MGVVELDRVFLVETRRVGRGLQAAAMPLILHLRQAKAANTDRVRSKFLLPERAIFQLPGQAIRRSPCLMRLQSSVQKSRSPEVQRKSAGEKTFGGDPRIS